MVSIPVPIGVIHMVEVLLGGGGYGGGFHLDGSPWFLLGGPS